MVSTGQYHRLHGKTGNACPWLAPANITGYMERMAASLTNVGRSHSGSDEFVKGRAYTQTTFIAVHLKWMAFPLTLLILGLIFLVATMVKTSRAGEEGMGMTDGIRRSRSACIRSKAGGCLGRRWPLQNRLRKTILGFLLDGYSDVAVPSSFPWQAEGKLTIAGLGLW